MTATLCFGSVETVDRKETPPRQKVRSPLESNSMCTRQRATAYSRTSYFYLRLVSCFSVELGGSQIYLIQAGVGVRIGSEHAFLEQVLMPRCV